MGFSTTAATPPLLQVLYFTEFLKVILWDSEGIIRNKTAFLESRKESLNSPCLYLIWSKKRYFLPCLTGVRSVNCPSHASSVGLHIECIDTFLSLSVCLSFRWQLHPDLFQYLEQVQFSCLWHTTHSSLKYPVTSDFASLWDEGISPPLLKLLLKLAGFS